MRRIPKNELEDIAASLRGTAFPKRKRFTPIDAEILVYNLFKQDDLKFEVTELPEGILGSYAVVNNRGHIQISTDHYNDPYKPRLNHTICHEIGHHNLHQDLINQHNGTLIDGKKQRYMKTLQEAIPYNTCEWQANYIAGAIRIPKEEIEEQHYTFMEQEKLLERFGNNLKAYQYIGEDLTLSLIKDWASDWNVSPFSLAVRMKYLNLLNIHGKSFIRYSPNTKQKVIGF